MAAWVASVVEASGGKLTMEVHKTLLAKPPGQYDLPVSCSRDISWGVPGPGRFVALRLWEMPFLSPSAEAGSEAVWYEKNGLIEKEYGDTHLITVWVHGPGILHTKKKVGSLADLRDMKIRGGGGVFLAERLGANPVAMPVTNAHESLRRGVIPGAFFPFEAIKGFRLEKLVTHRLPAPGGLYTVPFFMTINKKKWDSLSKNAQETLNRTGRRAGAKLIGRHWDATGKIGMDIARKNGNDIESITSVELENWRTRTDKIFMDISARRKRATMTGEALSADLKATVKR